MFHKPTGPDIIYAACTSLAILAIIGLLELIRPGLVPIPVSGKLSQAINVICLNIPELKRSIYLHI